MGVPDARGDCGIWNPRKKKKTGILREYVVGYKAIYKQNEHQASKARPLEQALNISAPLSRCGNLIWNSLKGTVERKGPDTAT